MDCGADLTDAPEVGLQRNQVFDLPPITVRVTEHQLISRRCACGATTCGGAPEGVTAPAGVRAADPRDHPLPVCRGSSCPRTGPRRRYGHTIWAPAGTGH